MPPIAVCQLAHRYLADCYRSIGTYTTFQTVAANGNHDAKRVALDLDLLVISGAPLNHAGRTQA
ncbi:hypothetical protein EUX57_19595 [Pseudomonas orientalis]|uniref:Uncharacterized protein n=1 Tax=Pseudomonas orientalis TaxID=76758 RepID=A0A4V2DXC1_9PSED|nr:hypothetical protein EUX57_19595 [Pseudomonas orientalis]